MPFRWRLGASLSFYIYLLAAGALALGGLSPAAPARAQDKRSELIELINALRASQGLAPYSVDAGLMAMAQEHSEYQAAIHKSTHQHSDGRVPPELGVTENVAGGDLGWIDPRTCVDEIWQDWGHMHAMIGYAQGAMGVGIADDGETEYYTLEVRTWDASASGIETATAAAGYGLTPIIPTPLVTMTPLPDGSIIHIVGYGQTLWSIALAYEVTVDQLRAWNNLGEGDTEIYAGQRLLVLPANLAPTRPPTPSPAPTATPPAQTGPAIAAAQTTAAPVSALAPPEQTPVSPEPTGAAGEATAAATQAGETSRRLLIPLIAGVSLVVGAVLLVVVFREVLKNQGS